MEKIRKSVLMKIAPLCLVFLLICLSSVYALAETKQNERLVLKDIPISSGPASRIIVMESVMKDYRYIIKTKSFASYKLSYTEQYRLPSDIPHKVLFEAETIITTWIADGVTIANIGFNINNLEDAESITFHTNPYNIRQCYLPRIWTQSSEHRVAGKVEFFRYKIASN